MLEIVAKTHLTRLYAYFYLTFCFIFMSIVTIKSDSFKSISSLGLPSTSRSYITALNYSTTSLFVLIALLTTTSSN
jgi:hypothetical protein